MEEEGQEFLQYVYPATVAKIEDAAAARRPTGNRWMLFLPIPAAAALATLLFVARPGPAPEPLAGDVDEIHTKGDLGPLGFKVFAATAAGAVPVPDGAAVAIRSAMRFQVTSSQRCRLWVVSVDARGQVSRLYPTGDRAGAELTTGGELPGGAVLDDASGPERFFAFCAPKPLPYATVERAVRRSVPRGAEGVRSVSAVSGLPEGTAQSSVLVEKKP
jgi:hypothetical protein